jgi:hypothetical protein
MRPMGLGLLLGAVLLAVSTLVAAQGHDVVIPYVPPPTDNTRLKDPVTKLAREIQAGKATLTAHAVGGTLPALLRALGISVSSQVLVFSKTSLQHEFISPRTPRAIYFNDDVYVGFVPDGGALEISSVDPDVGAVFYTAGRRAAAQLSLVTGTRCVQCHQIPATLGVAGHLMRSVFVRNDGTLVSGEPSFLTDDRSPFEERWGGWFVSGSIAGARHMGNAPLPAGERASAFDRARGTAITDVSRLFDHSRYLSTESDVVALMVLGHQVRMHNLIARLHRSATSDARDAGVPALDDQIHELLRYLLFVDAAPLPGAVTSPTTFVADFERKGRVDTKGRSLRQFDLKTRLFKYPCSYLIYSDAFLALPPAAKASIYTRLRAILAGTAPDLAFERLASADRTAILEILDSTHPEFAAAK